MLCRRRSRTCPGGSTRRRRRRRAGRTAPESTSGVARSSRAAPRSRPARRPRPAVRRRRSSGLRSTDATSGRPRRAARGRAARRRRASRSTAGSPRNGPSSAWVARSSIISCASTRVERHEPERDVGERLGEHAADAEHHARAELRVAVHAGDQLAPPRTIGGDSRRDRAVLGVGGREQLRRRRRRTRRVGAGRAARGRARSCARSRRRTASRPPGSRASRAAPTAASASATRSSSTGTPYSSDALRHARRGSARRGQRRQTAVVVSPELVAQHPLEQLAGVGARQLVAEPRSRAGACSRRPAPRRIRAARRGRSSRRLRLDDRVHPIRPTRRRGCRTPRRRAPAGARGDGFDLGG